VLQECYESVTRVLQECYRSVTRVSQGLYESITSMLRVCYKSVTHLSSCQQYLRLKFPRDVTWCGVIWCYGGVTMVLRWCYVMLCGVMWCDAQKCVVCLVFCGVVCCEIPLAYRHLALGLMHRSTVVL
jgi:hypothetical protein